MRTSLTSQARTVIILYILGMVGGLSVSVSGSEPQTDGLKILALSATPDPVPGLSMHKEYRTRPLPWKGHEYTPSEAIPVLMGVVQDPTSGPISRKEAFDVLDRLANQLGGTAWVPELIALYARIADREGKVGVLMCLVQSEDARAFPLYTRVLAQESDKFLRLLAAGGLSQWNVRSGVAELIRLFECTERLPNGRMIRDEAFGFFGGGNARKGWGFPEGEVRKSVEQTSEAGTEQAVALWIQEIKTWFAENQSRFPDWKPGDPLPEPWSPEPPKGDPQ